MTLNTKRLIRHAEHKKIALFAVILIVLLDCVGDAEHRFIPHA